MKTRTKPRECTRLKLAFVKKVYRLQRCASPTFPYEHCTTPPTSHLQPNHLGRLIQGFQPRLVPVRRGVYHCSGVNPNHYAAGELQRTQLLAVG